MRFERDAVRPCGDVHAGAPDTPARAFAVHVHDPSAAMRAVDLPMTPMTNLTQAVLTLDALVDMCARFDPSDADQRLIVRTMVVPMLARRLKWLELLLRACPHSPATRAMFEQVERALACASSRLDGPGLPSAGAAEAAQTAQTAQPTRAAPA